MRVVRRGDDDELNLRNRQQIINTAHNARVRIQLCRPVAAALHNRGKPQARDRMNHRRVKRASCQAKPDKSDIDHCSQEPSKFAEERTRICVRDVPCLAFNSKLPPEYRGGGWLGADTGRRWWQVMRSSDMVLPHSTRAPT